MICPICAAENPDTATLCRSCRAYLQDRVPYLDLFNTLWGLVESPGKTFHVIARSEHKNYAFLLFATAGIPALASMASLFRAGELFPTLLEAMFAVLAGGVFMGLVSAPVVSVVHALVVRLLGGAWSFRTSLGVTSYALAPGAIIGLVLLLIQLLTFGMYYFTSNPPAATIKPVSYWALVVLQSLVLIWSIGLLMSGTARSCRLTGIKSALASLIFIAAAGTGWWWATRKIYEGLLHMS